MPSMPTSALLWGEFPEDRGVVFRITVGATTLTAGEFKVIYTIARNV